MAKIAVAVRRTCYRRAMQPWRLEASLALALTGSLACAPSSADDGEATEATGATSDATTGDSTETETETTTGDATETDTGGDDERDALIAELDAWGPYAVGYQTVELSYMPPGASEPRDVRVELWYPAAPDSGAGQATYKLAGIVTLPTGIGLDAPPVSDAGPFPVAIYSHGSGGDGILAYPYAERFASHGWVLISPSHTGNTAGDAFAGFDDRFVEVAYNRPLDVSAGLDALEAGFGDPDLAAVVDTSRSFMFGHSFGGFTTLVVGGATLDHASLVANCDPVDCPFLETPAVADQFAAGFRDERVLALSPQAPGLIPELGAMELAELELPTMLQSGRLDLRTPHDEQAAPCWAGLDHPDDRWIDLVLGAHYSFFTMCDDLDPNLLALFEPNAVNDGCGPEFTPSSELVPLLGTYLMAYARLHVLGEAQWGLVIDGEPLHADIEHHP